MVSTQIRKELRFAHTNEKNTYINQNIIFVKCDILAGLLHWTNIKTCLSCDIILYF